MMWYDSWEIDEYKYPLIFEKLEILPDSAAPGKYRGAPQVEFILRSRCDNLSIVITADGRIVGPKGAIGGHDGRTGGSFVYDDNGLLQKTTNFYQGVQARGKKMRGLSTGGGGYGPP